MKFKSYSKDGLSGIYYRNRIFSKALIFISIMFKSSIQRELDSFSKAVSNSDFKIWKIARDASTQTRSRLNS